MQKEKYINQNKINAKHKLFLTIGISLAIIFVLMLIVSLIETRNNKPENILQTKVKETLEDFDCSFIKMKDSREDGFVYDIYVKFKYDLYEGDNSEEEFYNKVIEEIAEVLEYKNFRMIDTSRNSTIEIAVICEENKIKKIYINGMEDYFIYMESKKNVDKYEEIKNSKIEINSKELRKCVQNGWLADTDFGTRETIFQNYYIYFDEGIEVRKIGGQIYNIIFTNKYQETVVNGFTVGTKCDIIKKALGEPTFKNEDETVIGYKNSDLYVFFEENQISVYKNTSDISYDEFFKLTDKFLNDEYSLLEFMNELTYLWPDYEEYSYNSNVVFISYPHKGIDIKINYDNVNGIVLYNNIRISKEELIEHLKNTEFIADLQTDNIYNAELRRIEKINSFSEKCDKYKEEYEAEDTKNRGDIYNYYMNIASNDSILNIFFISQNQEYPNCELNENINSYIWAKDDLFIYSIEKQGIYYYDLKNQKKGNIIKGTDNFDIKSIENGILTYDEEKTVQINY